MVGTVKYQEFGSKQLKSFSGISFYCGTLKINVRPKKPPIERCPRTKRQNRVICHVITRHSEIERCPAKVCAPVMKQHGVQTMG